LLLENRKEDRGNFDPDLYSGYVLLANIGTVGRAGKYIRDISTTFLLKG
jgi:hypothetical protein